jgi:thymidylate kinase
MTNKRDTGSRIMVAFEGPDGAGKSTLLRALWNKLHTEMEVPTTRWSHLGLRWEAGPWELAMHYASKRFEFASSLADDSYSKIVLLDRWTQSNLTSPCEQANTLALLEEQMLPRLDGIVLLDGSDEELDRRLAARGLHGEVNEDRHRLRKAYREIYLRYGCCAWWPQNTLVINTSQRNEESVEREVRHWVEAIVTERSIA